MPSKNRPRLVASSSSSTKLFVDDLREVARLTSAEGKTQSDIIRELVHEALRLRRLQAIGRDAGEDYLRRIQQQAITEGLSPVLQELTELRALMTNPLARTKAEPHTPVDHHQNDEKLGSATANGTRSSRVQVLLTMQVLRRLFITENVVKVLMTVGMQRDNLSAVEIKEQLALQDETGLQQAQQLIQQILPESQPTPLPDNHESHKAIAG